MKKLYLRTLKGRIVTLSIAEETETHLIGYGKYGEPVSIKKEDIDPTFPK